MARRKTIKDAFRVTGTGVFTGASCSVELRPAGVGTGIAFRAGEATFRAIAEHRTDRVAHPAFAAMPPRNTALAADPGDDRSPCVQTVEHLLGALAGVGVTDVLAIVDGPEVPIGDGSGVLFSEPIEDIGVRDLDADASPIVVTREARLATEDGVSEILIEPSGDGTSRWRYELDYGDGAPIPACDAEWHGDAVDFAERIAPARTFSLLREVEAMRAMGLFTSFSPRELLVIGDDGTPVDNAYRSPDEPALHKLLDMIGDFALFTGGRPLIGRVTGVRSGHRLNHAAAATLAEITE